MAAAVNSVLNKREIADGTCCEIYSKDDFFGALIDLKPLHYPKCN